MALPFLFRFGLQGVGPAVKNLKQVKGGLKDTGETAEKSASNFSSASASLGLLGTTMMGVAGSAVWAAASMEKSMVGLDLAFQRAGTSAEGVYQGLARIGLATPGLLKVAGIAAKFGIEGEENLTAFTETSRQMGVVLGVSAKEAGEQLGKLAGSLGKSSLEMRGISSAMIAMERRFPTTIKGMTQLLDSTGALANEVGLSEGTLLGFAGAASAAGIDVGDANSFIATLTDNMRLMKGEGIGLSGVFQMMGGSVEDFMAMNMNEKALAVAESLGK
ncbi:MAG TPA: phage tail tape measure protein, partial [Planctomycetota bacterium]|nr:phage tail tape measure protein [Planctomycetota bacterium]